MPMNPVEVTPRIAIASDEDWAGLSHLHYLSHTISFRSFADRNWLSSRCKDSYNHFWRQFLRQVIPGKITWMYMKRGEIAGTITCMPLSCSDRRFQPSTPFELHQTTVLRLMYVHPKYKRMGIGSSLHHVFCRESRALGYRRATLITHSCNQVARAFYESNGWRHDADMVAQIEGFFSEPANMRKRTRYRIDLDEPVRTSE